MRRTWLDAVAAGVATGYVLASTALAVVIEQPTTYAAIGSPQTAATIVPGWALLVAGTWTVWLRPSHVGRVTTASAVVWLAPVWVGWGDGPAVVRSLAMLIVPFAPALVLHLVLATPDGRPRSRPEQRAVTAAYAATFVFTLVRATIRDPFLDRYCWDNCSDNAFLIHADATLARFWDTAREGVVMAGGVLVAAIAVRRLWTASSVGRRRWSPVLVPAAAAAMGESAHAALLLVVPPEDPAVTSFAGVHLYRATAYTVVAFGVAWMAGRARRTTAALHRLIDDWEVQPAGMPLSRAFAATLGDPSAQITYWLPDTRCYVDPEGRPAPSRGADRLATPIVRRGEPVALVTHDPALSLTRDDTAGIGAAARLAVDNERLRAGLLKELAELRESRARVVAVGDAARRRLERDLHDGAQQLLLALSFELRMARAAASRHGDAAQKAALSRACAQAQAAIVELRALAHGIHPAVLTESGIGPALQTLGDTAPVPLEVRRAPVERFGDGAELAVYLLVASLVETSQEPLVIDVERSGDVLVTSAAPVRDTPDVGVTDRVAALGGTVEVRDSTLWAEVPCA
jgi:signal transduction histidine kinase